MGSKLVYATILLAAVFTASNAATTARPPRPSVRPPRPSGRPPRPSGGPPPPPSGLPPLLPSERPPRPPRDVCSPESRASDEGLRNCIRAIRRKMQDNRAFWFGLDYPARCPVPELTIECINFSPAPTSMADRLFPTGEFNATTITSYLDVVIHEKPGKYQGCGHEYVLNNTADHVLDPISPEPLTPWQSSKGFTMSVQGLRTQPGRREEQYTLVIVDAGYHYLHGIYINIPESGLSRFDSTQGEIVMPYSGPKYYKPDPLNPYVFLVFRQERSFRPMQEPILRNILRTILGLPDRSRQMMEPMTFFDFVEDYVSSGQLAGPVAVNWLMSTSDAYAAQYMIDNGFNNMCPLYVQEAARELDLYYPGDAEFTVSVDVTYVSRAMEVQSCCKEYSYDESTTTLDPIGNTELTPFEVRRPPNVMLTKKKIMPLPTDFNGEFYTLLLVDPDWLEYPTVGTQAEPLMLWLTTNIRFGRVRLGRPIVPYFLPEGNYHQYEFLLYKQMERVGAVNASDFGHPCLLPDNTDLGLGPRCRFDVGGLVSQMNLTFVGASWFTGTTSEPWFNNWLIENGWATEELLCEEVPGYEDPCPGKEDTGFSACIAQACVPSPGPHCVEITADDECCPTYNCTDKGMCPMITEDTVGTCDTECEVDMDCSEMGYKCCSNGCGRVCVQAITGNSSESESDESESDESESDESESDESESDESESDESESDESESDESESDESENDESESDESETDESESDESESDESETDESETDESENDDEESDAEESNAEESNDEDEENEQNEEIVRAPSADKPRKEPR